MNNEAYDLGWGDGYSDNCPNCPYEEGSDKYDEYYKGYEQGSMDC